jgi:hypothetical protein
LSAPIYIYQQKASERKEREKNEEKVNTQYRKGGEEKKKNR